MSIQKNNHTFSEGKLKTPPLSLSSNKNYLNSQIKTSYLNKQSFHMSNIRITNNFENRGTKNFSENISLQLSKPSSMPIQYFQTTNKKNKQVTRKGPTKVDRKNVKNTTLKSSKKEEVHKEEVYIYDKLQN